MAIQWYVQAEGKEFGPYTSPQLKEFAQNGRINMHTLVRPSHDQAWHHAAEVKGLFAGEIPPTPKPSMPLIQPVANADQVEDGVAPK